MHAARRRKFEAKRQSLFEELRFEEAAQLQLHSRRWFRSERRLNRYMRGPVITGRG